MYKRQASEGVALSGQGFNEGKGKPFTSEDIRFTTKGNVLYAIILNVSGNSDINIKTLAKKSPVLQGRKIYKVSLLGSTNQLKWSQTETGLSTKVTGTGIVVLKIEGALSKGKTK